jgi:hypothetical protein
MDTYVLKKRAKLDNLENSLWEMKERPLLMEKFWK